MNVIYSFHYKTLRFNCILAKHDIIENTNISKYCIYEALYPEGKCDVFVSPDSRPGNLSTRAAVAEAVTQISR